MKDGNILRYAKEQVDRSSLSSVSATIQSPKTKKLLKKDERKKLRSLAAVISDDETKIINNRLTLAFEQRYAVDADSF